MTSPAMTLAATARARSTPSTVQVGSGRATVSQPVHTTRPPIAPTASAGRRSSPAVRASTTIHPRLTHRNARIPSDSTARPRSASDGTAPELPTSPPTGCSRDPGCSRTPGTPQPHLPVPGPPVGEATPPGGREGAPVVHSPGQGGAPVVHRPPGRQGRRLSTGPRAGRAPIAQSPGGTPAPGRYVARPPFQVAAGGQVGQPVVARPLDDVGDPAPGG